MTRQEEIARIIDPASWRNFDYWGKPGPRQMTPEALQVMVRPSLDKATAIMALFGVYITELVSDDCPNGGRCFTPEQCAQRGHCGGEPVTA